MGLRGGQRHSRRGQRRDSGLCRGGARAEASRAGQGEAAGVHGRQGQGAQRLGQLAGGLAVSGYSREPLVGQQGGPRLHPAGSRAEGCRDREARGLGRGRLHEEGRQGQGQGRQGEGQRQGQGQVWREGREGRKAVDGIGDQNLAARQFYQRLPPARQPRHLQIRQGLPGPRRREDPVEDPQQAEGQAQRGLRDRQPDHLGQSSVQEGPREVSGDGEGKAGGQEAVAGGGVDGAAVEKVEEGGRRSRGGCGGGRGGVGGGVGPG
mmetsp:Transcript_2211/g.5969  ORF Transcript_2211/g.5969 Transcript_2211/m.5969 type:complete len:264 (-) Transcript_2211:84-875(-)